MIYIQLNNLHLLVFIRVHYNPKFSLSAISEKIGKPSPPNSGGKGRSFLSMLEQLMPPDIAPEFVQLVQQQ